MSQVAISQALEMKLKEIDEAMPTAWENTNFNPVAGVAYQEVWPMFAKPENPTLGDDFYRERGYLHVKLKYPQNVGRAAALARAELLRATFKRGLSLDRGGVTTVIDETPEIGPRATEGDRFVINVFIRFYANIGG